MALVTVRYIVDDVDAALEFYCRHLGFTELMHPAPMFAILTRGDLRLLLSAPSGRGGGGQVLPDGTRPAPGGWNRFSLEVPDLAASSSSNPPADPPCRGERPRQKTVRHSRARISAT
jgi:catechol 2,3-dioxygenase-like lactoylglutathione lyase family enzyme